MFLELHILQNFAPANLNRDDTGSPKDCEFGGYRRARISSQCLKRAVRQAFIQRNLLPSDVLAQRTKRLGDEVAQRLERRGHDREQARDVVELALDAWRVAIAPTRDENAERKTEYLLYVARSEIEKLAVFCHDNWEELAKTTATLKAGKRAGKGDNVPRALREPLQKILDDRRAADLALFGRMLADLPEKNVDAACQMAHALSTNKVSMEFDYYTAVDDLKPDDTAGADMIGTVEFNSSCFYRYANIDLSQLRRNLVGDDELTLQTVEAFVRASIAAVPGGKRNSTAAQNPPSLVFAVARTDGLWSLANAFLSPMRPTADGDLVERSIAALDRHWAELAAMYGDEGIRDAWVCTLGGNSLKALADRRVSSVSELVQGVRAAAASALSEGQGHA